MNIAVESAAPPRKSRRIAGFAMPVFVLCAAALLGGCESTGGQQDAEGDEPTIFLKDENSYTTQSSLSIPTVETAAGDLDICWTDAVSDLQCHDVAPQPDIDNVALLRFTQLSEEQVEQRLTASQLSQSEVDGYLEYHTDYQSSCTKLSSMSFFGTKIEIEEEYVESTDHTYMLLFAEGTTPGVGARTMIFIKPTAASTNTRVDAVAGCGLLDFSADLAGAAPVEVPMKGPWRVDWRGLTRDGQGNDVAFESIDSVLLAFYEGKTVTELQAQIFDIELIATTLYELSLTGGRTADLANAQERGTGALFPGFAQEQEGVWLLGLMCSTCQNPAPILLSVVSPVAEGT